MSISTGAQTPSLAQAPADLDAVDTRQHEVEDDRVVLGRLCHPESIVSGAGDVDCVALLREPAAEQACHLELVLDDQDPHALSLSLPR